MVYFLVITAADGEHVRRYQTERAARAALTRQFGHIRPAGWILAQALTDAHGRRLWIETWPDGTTLKDRRLYGPAYDARECGRLTRAQRRLLRRLETVPA